jgi:hypothetical protein
MHDNNSRFGVAAGSVTGREHLRLHRNNQDGVAVRVEPERVVAVVCDGCSAGASSEVGARLGAAFVAAHLPRVLDEGGGSERLTDDLCAYLEHIAAGLGGGPSVVRDYLLFTLLAAVVEPGRTRIFGLGDGLYSTDGEVHVLGPYPDNAPPYVAYRLVDRALCPPALPCAVEMLHESAAQTVILGSDGLDALAPGELASLAERCRRNPSLLQKGLNVWERRFADDASAVVIQRAP